MDKITLILKPTLECNLNCGYCYFGEMRNRGRMKPDILENLFSKVADNFAYITCIWHGGEPMLMGIDFYERALEIQEKYGLNARNTFQTNLTLLDNDWIDFFRENKFTVSTSLDGVKEVHDKGRRGSFDIVVKNIRRLQDNGFKVGTVSLMNEYSLPFLYDNFKLFADLGVSVRINPQTACPGNKDAITTGIKSYEFALRYYCDMYLGQRLIGKKLRIDPVCEIFDYVRTGKTNGCIFGDNCVGRFPAILPNGDVVHCGRFVGTGYCEFGNISSQDFSFDIKKNSEMARIFDLNEKRISKCGPCEYFDMCHAGCFYHGWLDGVEKDHFCEAFKQLFQHVMVRERQLGGCR